jgi:hypothetical protein
MSSAHQHFISSDAMEILQPAMRHSHTSPCEPEPHLSRSVYDVDVTPPYMLSPRHAVLLLLLCSCIMGQQPGTFDAQRGQLLVTPFSLGVAVD